MIEIFSIDRVQNLLIAVFILGLLLIMYSFQKAKDVPLKIQFSLEESKCWKGLFSLFIVMDHLWMYYNMPTLAVFHESAVIIVSIYFFFSGYGLSISTMNNQDYIGSDFWKKKVRYLVFPMVVVDFIMLTWRCFYGLRIDLSWLFRYVLGRELPNAQTWYIRELLICYFLFYILVKMRFKARGIIAGCIIGITLMNILLFIHNYWYNWYCSSYGFVLGVCFGYSEGGAEMRFKEVVFFDCYDNFFYNDRYIKCYI